MTTKMREYTVAYTVDLTRPSSAPEPAMFSSRLYTFLSMGRELMDVYKDVEDLGIDVLSLDVIETRQVNPRRRVYVVKHSVEVAALPALGLGEAERLLRYLIEAAGIPQTEGDWRIVTATMGDGRHLR